MSIITYTYRDGVQQLAADTQITDSLFGTKVNVQRFKVLPWSNNGVLGVVGDAALYGYICLFHATYDFPAISSEDEYSLINVFHEYLISLRQFIKQSGYSDFEEHELNIILVTPYGAVAADGFVIIPVHSTYQLGTSLDVASYILMSGGTALEAAQAVCDTNITCSGPIEVYTFEDGYNDYTYDVYDI